MADELQQQQIVENNTVETTQEQKDQEKRLLKISKGTVLPGGRGPILMKSGKYVSKHRKCKTD